MSCMSSCHAHALYAMKFGLIRWVIVIAESQGHYVICLYMADGGL